MPSTATHSAIARAPSLITNLLTELRHADNIFKVMLNVMTIQQKAKVAEQLEAAGVAGDGMTRHHERAAVIAAVTAAPACTCTASNIDTIQQLRDIEAQAVDVQLQAGHADILLRLLFERLDQVGDALPIIATVNCLATCTARAVTLMREAADSIVALVAEGGAA